MLAAFGCTKDHQIGFAQFADFYLTKSLTTSSDTRFREELLQFWLLSEIEAKAYIHQHFPDAKPAKYRRKYGALGCESLDSSGES
jgi:hypothetical protein